MSKDAVRQNLTIRRGDDWGDEVTLAFTGSDGQPLDISGAQIWMTIRERAVPNPFATDITHPPIAQITSPAVADGPGGITVLNATAGEARPALTAAQTRRLTKRFYAYDVELVLGVGPLAGKRKTTQVGAVIVLDDVTLGVAL
jgi:hypothetical protein